MVVQQHYFGNQARNPKPSVIDNPNYTGCFVCGEKTHDFRSCPDRGRSSASTSAKSKMVCMVQAVEDQVPPGSSADPTFMSQPSTIQSLPATQDVQRMVLAAGDPSDPNRLVYAVIDTGATETVGSLDAIEFILSRRFAAFGHEEVGVDPKRVKRFKFGNAQERWAESYLLLPQTIQGTATSLGVYTLDVPNVPILLGIKYQDPQQTWS